MDITQSTQGAWSGKTTYNLDQNRRRQKQKEVRQSQWKTVGVKVRYSELSLLNRQLDRLNYVTLGELVKDLISGKISRVTEDKQIEIMSTNLHTNGQLAAVEGKITEHAATEELVKKIEKMYGVKLRKLDANASTSDTRSVCASMSERVDLYFYPENE